MLRPLGRGIAIAVASPMTSNAAHPSVRALVGSVLSLCSACACPSSPDDLPANPTITLSAEEYESARQTSSEAVCERCNGGSREAALREAGFFAGEITVDCSVSENADGGATVECHVGTQCDAGRAPRALAASPRSSLEGWWANMALREAEAITAFDELALELAALGAPAAFIERARAAREDEVRHAELCASMASVAVPPAPRLTLTPFDPMRFVELNAAEGCIRETFAVIDTLARASRASDARTREVLRTIAMDELQHAQLSWDIDAWARRHLGPPARSTSLAAKRRATRQLVARAGRNEAHDGPVALAPQVRRALAYRFIHRLAA